MAVDSGMWWSVWWPWTLVWAATAVSLIVAVVLLVIRAHRYRRRLRQSSEKPTEGICLYLHDRAIMNLYEMGRYEKALEREVEHRITGSTDGSLRARIFGVGVSGGRNVSREEISTYIESAKPITVIGLIVDTLERTDAIVHGDLRTRTITWNHALARSLDTDGRPGRGAGAAVRLRDIEDFVSLRGRFRKAGQTDARTVFLAPYGDPEDPAQGPQVRVVCATDGLRNDDSHDGTFPARCLGKVRDWNPRTGELTVEAIAIFS
ncbi:hypothetical protein PS467_35015 [Streptomyces luomodiensis]|uniref:Uncharacterized protein n=1 Tax=Streptomyces luomodiensis TaxID=3026192 RepID=A0ABY9V679_9ACTN|nr:hypothetical protein [Streptomyces sp. SCA4-21]WNF00157.1 hypothetical protein PS467_35015 [Streptomyces sp. SCA4-21]